MWLGLVAIFFFVFILLLLSRNASQVNNEDLIYENEDELELLEDEILLFMDEDEEDHL